LELGQPRLSGLVSRSHSRVVCGFVLVQHHKLSQLLMLLVPPTPQLFKAVKPLATRRRERGEARSVDPYRIAGSTQFQHCNGFRGLCQQLTVVTHHQH
jgi:hypothetical protein